MTLKFKIYLSILNKIINYIHIKYPNYKNDIINSNKKKCLVHIFKSNFLIKLFFIFSCRILKIFGIGIYKNIFPFFYNKLEELILSVLFIHNKKLKENYEIKKFNSEKKYFEFLVIGSGPSGAVTSYYLNKKFEGKVGLIERGKSISNFKRKHPPEEFLNMWKNGGLNTTIFKNQIPFAAGNTLGGGSEINSGLFHLPGKEFIESWANEHDVLNISTDQLEKKFSELLKISPVTKLTSTNGSSDYFINGAKKNNFKIDHVDQFYTKTEGGLIKNSMSNTFIKKFIQDNGNIINNLDVDKIYFSKPYWHICGTKNKKKIQLKSKYLFLNAGSIETNQILIKSNIHKENVKNFYFHPMVKFIVEFEKEIQSGNENVHPYQINYKNFSIFGEASSGMQFIKGSSFMDKKNRDYISKNWKKMSIYHTTFSAGEGKIIKIPIINDFLYSYNLKEIDMKKVQNSINTLCKILFDGGAKKIYILNKYFNELTPESYEAIIQKYIKKVDDLKYSSVHILGGIRSGEKNNCLVDSYGKVKDYENLFIYDSSLINHKLLKNPQGTIMAISKRNVDNFIKNL